MRSPKKSQSRAAARLAWFTISGANFVIVLGMLGLAGWILRLPSLLRVWSDAPAMAVDTAILLIVAGVGLLSVPACKSTLSLLCGAFLILVASASKLTENTGYHVSAHRLFSQRTAEVLGTTDPVILRMNLPPVLIGVFVLFGLFLILSAVSRPRALILWSTAVAGTSLTSLGSLGIIAVLCKVHLQAQRGSFLSQMSPVTALAASVLGLSLCAHLAARSRFVYMRAGISSAVLGLISLVLLIAGVDYAIMSGSQQMVGAQSCLSEAQMNTKALQTAMYSVHQAEAGEGGFLLTQDERYLADYTEGVRSAEAFLRGSPLRDHAQQPIALLTRLLEKELDEIRRTIHVAQTGELDTARALFRSPRRWRLSAEIRKQMDAAIGQDRCRVKQNSAANRNALIFIRKVVFCSFVLSACLIGIAVYLVLLEYRRWSSEEASHRGAEIALERRVQERTLEYTEEAKRRELAEYAYRQAQNSLHTALDFSNVAVWIWNPACDSVAWNGPVHRLYEISGEELHSYRCFEAVVHPDDREQVRQEIGIAMADGRDYKAEFRILLPNGQIRWLAGRGRALFDNNRLTQVSGVNFDITKLKETELELRSREQALQARDRKIEFIFKNVTIGDWTWNLVQNRIFAHRMIWNLFGSPEQPGGENPSWFVSRQHPEDRFRFERAADEAVRGGEPLDVDVRVMRPDGEVRWLTCRGNLVSDMHGYPVEMQGLILDITERKKVEIELKESEARFRHLADAMPQIVWQARPDGQIDCWNARWYELTKWGTSLPLQTSWLDVLHPDDRQPCDDTWQFCVQSGIPFECEVRLRENTQYRWYLSRGTPIRNHQDEIVRWFGTITDIHEQKAAKELLEVKVQSRTEELRRALREKDVLFQEVHHRVKNNLQVITSLLRMQGETVEDPAARKALQECQHRVLSMALIHERLYSREKVADLDFGEYAQSLIDSLLLSYSRSTNIRTTLRSDGIRLDVEQAIPCGLILNELITNAIKYAYPKAKPGEIRISLEKDTSHQILLMVADDGVGLPPGFSVSQARSLGMSIVATLVHQLDGTLNVESQGGTKASVRFPHRLRTGKEENAA